MAKNNTNAAEEVETTPELEVIEGEATSVVEPEEIEALLEEMAKQNEEDDLAAAALAAATQEAAATLETQTESVEAIEAIEPAVEELVEEALVAAQEPEAPVTGPSFTMEDVLRAASESTSFSVDEIKNMEAEEESPADLFEEAIESETEVAIDETEPELESAAIVVDAQIEIVEVRDEPESEKKSLKVKVPKLSIAGDWKDWLRKPAFIGAAATVIAIVGMLAFMGMKVSKVESKLASKQKSLESSIEESKDLLENLNMRFASMDRSLQSKGASHSTSVSHKEPSHAPVKPLDKGHETKPHSTKAAIHEPAKDIGHEATNSHKPAKTAHKPQPYATAKPKGPNGDHYDPNALVEGFKPSELFIAKHSSPSHSKSKGKSRTAHAKPKAKPHVKNHVATKTVGTKKGTSMQVYDSTGKPIDRITVHAPSGH